MVINDVRDQVSKKLQEEKVARVAELKKLYQENWSSSIKPVYDYKERRWLSEKEQEAKLKLLLPGIEKRVAVSEGAIVKKVVEAQADPAFAGWHISLNSGLGLSGIGYQFSHKESGESLWLNKTTNNAILVSDDQEHLFIRVHRPDQNRRVRRMFDLLQELLETLDLHKKAVAEWWGIQKNIHRLNVSVGSR